ncbi:MAG: hypothetical protein R3Y36_04470 [Spirochaetales bacterium]
MSANQVEDYLPGIDGLKIIEKTDELYCIALCLKQKKLNHYIII